MRANLVLFIMICMSAVSLGLARHACSQSNELPEVATVNMGAYHWPAAIDVADDLLYVAARGVGLRIFQFVPPASGGSAQAPVEIGFLDTPDTDGRSARSNDVQVVGKYAYIADGMAGVRLIDVSNPRRPALLDSASLLTDGSAKAVLVSGDRLYVACGPETWADSTSFSGLIVARLQFDNLGRPLQPQEIGRYVVPRPDNLPLTDWGSFPVHMDIKERDGLVFAAMGFAGLYVLDASAPDASQPDDGVRLVTHVRPPALPGHPVFNSYASDIRFQGNRLLVGFMCLGLHVFNIVRESETGVRLEEIGVAPVATLGGYARRMDFFGDRVVVAERFDGVRILELSTLPAQAPSAGQSIPEPRTLARSRLSTEAAPLDAFDVRVVGDYAIVADFGQVNSAVGGFWPDPASSPGYLRVFDLSGVEAPAVSASSQLHMFTVGAREAAHKRNRSKPVFPAALAKETESGL